MRVPFLLMAVALSVLALSQDRLKSMPGAKEYAAAQQASAKASPVLARANGDWDSSGKYHFTYAGKARVYDPQTNQTVEESGFLQSAEAATSEMSGRPHQSPGRGRQSATVRSQDGKIATYKDGNITIQSAGKSIAVTTDGDPAKRIKYGTASWVYGEELEQRDAMGFSPDGRWLWYYRFDERAVKDYFVLNNQLGYQNSVAVEAYPKPGQPNPIVDLFVLDTQTGTSQQVKVREGQPDDSIGHYVYSIFWRPDSKALIFHRMNRAQNEQELCAYDVADQKVKTVYRQENKGGWVDLGPLDKLVPRGLTDTSLYTLSESSGWMNLIKIDLVNGGSQPVTQLKADVLGVIAFDPNKESIDYLAADGDGPYRTQLHRCRIDGKDDRRLTDPAANHEVKLSPDGRWVADEATYPGKAPELRILDSEGHIKATLATSNVEAFTEGGFQAAEFFEFPSLDGREMLYGYVHKPFGFDPARKYPVLLDVYGGPLPPAWGHPKFEWKRSSPMANYGFVVVEVFGRGGQARGRAFRQAIFHGLGGVEIDDMAAAVKSLGSRPYVDSGRVGIFGTSYGGFSSAMALCRYPDVFQAASASSMVADWRDYDSTYTERYMGLLPAQQAIYDKGSVLTYAKNAKGWLMVYFGTADDNTHPANSLQFIEALRRSGKSLEVQVGVDRGHSGLGQERMLEFFIERLVLGPNPKTG